MVEPDGRSQSLRLRKFGEDFGCFLPFVSPPIALVIGWSLGGVYVGLASAVIVGVSTIWLMRRLFGHGAMVEFGCVVLLIIVMLTLLVPAVEKIRAARERKRQERETGWLLPHFLKMALFNCESHDK